MGYVMMPPTLLNTILMVGIVVGRIQLVCIRTVLYASVSSKKTIITYLGTWSKIIGIALWWTTEWMVTYYAMRFWTTLKTTLMAVIVAIMSSPIPADIFTKHFVPKIVDVLVNTRQKRPDRCIGHIYDKHHHSLILFWFLFYGLFLRYFQKLCLRLRSFVILKKFVIFIISKNKS